MFGTEPVRETTVAFSEKEWEKTREQIHLILSFIWRFEGAAIAGYGAFFVWVISQIGADSPVINPLWYIPAGLAFQLVLILRLKIEYSILMCLSVYSHILEEVIMTSGARLEFDQDGIPHFKKPREYVDQIERRSCLPSLKTLFLKKASEKAKTPNKTDDSGAVSGERRADLNRVPPDAADVSEKAEPKPPRAQRSAAPLLSNVNATEYGSQTDWEKRMFELVPLGWEKFLWRAEPDRISLRAIAIRYTNTSLGLALILVAHGVLGLAIYFSAT